MILCSALRLPKDPSDIWFLSTQLLNRWEVFYEQLFDTWEKILLYGAATRGNILLDIFQRKGYQVTAFVDQRAHEIKTYCDLPVYTISELSTRISGKSEYAVYIDLKNVFEHDSVALELFNAGFKNLIFRPGRVLLGTGNEQELSLNDIYDILADEHADSRCSILPVDTIRFPQIKDFSLLHETSDGHCIIKVPCVLVFSDLEKRTSNGKISASMVCIRTLRYLKILLGKIMTVPKHISKCVNPLPGKTGWRYGSMALKCVEKP